MNVQTRHQEPRLHNHSPYIRRIPRGTGEVRDSISRLERQAVAHHRHIRGMKQRVKYSDDRNALEAARLRLIGVLRTIAERPWEVVTGTREIILDAMSEARSIYTAADKINGSRRTARKGARPAEEKGVRAKSLPSDYTGEREVEASESSAVPEQKRGEDLIAIAFQNGIDAGMINK